MLPYHVETAGSVSRDMLPILVTVTIQPLMVSTAIKVSYVQHNKSKCNKMQTEI